MVVATYAFAVLPAVAAKTSQRPRVTRVDASGVPHGKDGRVFSGRASCPSAPKAVTARGSGFARTFGATHRRDVRRFADNEKNRNNTDEEGTGKVRLDGKDDASNDESQKNFFQSYASKTKTAMEQIQSLGMAGVTCYGILNTVYYTLAFSAAWTFRSVPADLSTAEAFKLAGTTMALVWTGSQVTKLARLGLAVAGAPKIDSLIKQVCEKTGWRYESVFVSVTFGCVAGSAALFSVLILAKAALA